jgi:mono/diheme cytochrome c family protein
MRSWLEEVKRKKGKGKSRKARFPAVAGGCVLIALWTGAAGAADLENGRGLHEQHCVRCHTPALYVREKRLVSDYEALRERVRQCELAVELAWFDEEVDDVAEYLNDIYYRFERAP